MVYRLLTMACVLRAIALPARGGPITATFTDRTVAAGVDYVQWDPSTCQFSCGFPSMLGSAAAGDYDNDGRVDIYATRFEAPNLLFRNLGDGTFEEVAANAGVDLASRSSAVAWIDVNNDGFLDLLVLALLGRHYLYINEADGTFTERAKEFNIAAITPLAIEPTWTGIAAGDYDLDGDLDLHLTGWGESGLLNQLHRNEGGARFVDVTVSAGVLAEGVRGFAPSFADVTGDGWADLLVVADFGTSRLFENLRNGRFRDVTTLARIGDEENGMGSAIGDLDNDGDLDWFVTSIYDPDVDCTPPLCNVGWGGTGNRLYINDGAGGFTDGTDAWGVRDGAWGWGTSFLDFDNDGRLDLAETNGINFSDSLAEDKFRNLPARLWHNTGAGTMGEVAASCSFTSALEGKALLVFDYDNDGDEDVMIVNNADHPVLYRNNGGNEGAYLRVDARGTVSNHFAIGTVVRATLGDVTQTRLVGANSNFMGHSERIVHFGFGPGVETVDRVTVEWPASAIVQTRERLDANQVVIIREPGVGDFQDDGDIDLGDFALFATCLAAPQSGDRPAAHCARATDLRDFAMFQRAFTAETD